jgi:ATP-dependent Clp protease adapter protein ClpS
MTWAFSPPGVIADEDLAHQVGEVFDDLYAVVILDSDHTTFAEVEGACVSLFGYTAEEAAALAMRVHTTGQAVAAIMPKDMARQAVRSLRRWNVRARIEKA